MLRGRRGRGRGERIRTSDILLPKQALYQAEPRPGPATPRVLAGSGGPRNVPKRERIVNMATSCVTITTQNAPRLSAPVLLPFCRSRERAGSRGSRHRESRELCARAASNPALSEMAEKFAQAGRT
jgi:hypothetical protein